MPLLYKMQDSGIYHAILLAYRNILHWNKMGDFDRDFLHALRRCGKLGIEVRARSGVNILQITTAHTGTLSVTYHKIFLFSDRINQVYAADAVKILYMITLFHKVVSEIQFLIRIINHSEPQRKGTAACPL